MLTGLPGMHRQGRTMQVSTSCVLGEQNKQVAGAQAVF